MGLTPDGRRIRTASAITHCDFCFLSREDFEELISNDIRIGKVVRQTVKSHVARLRAAARGNGIHQPSRLSAFYQRLCFVDWHRALDEMVIRRKQAKERVANAEFSEAKIEALKIQEFR